jgi:hypothetical protein
MSRFFPIFQFFTGKYTRILTPLRVRTCALLLLYIYIIGKLENIYIYNRKLALLAGHLLSNLLSNFDSVSNNFWKVEKTAGGHHG